MAKLRKIGVLFSAKMSAFFGTIIGFLCGIIYALGGFLYEAVTGSLNVGTLLAFGALIGMPLIFAVCAFMVGGIGAVAYNIWARKFGGISADFEID